VSEKVVIIGNGPAGMSAAAAARISNRKAKITVVDQKDYETYHPCALPMVIGGYLPTVDSVVEELNFDMMKIDLHTSSIVDSIDTKKKEVSFHKKKEEDNKQAIPYDKLIVCTGSNVFVPPIPGRDLKNVFTLKYAEDAKAIKDATTIEDEDHVQRVIVVGGSAIGIEVATELARREKDVTIIEMIDQLLPGKVSKKYAELVKKALIKSGVNVRTGMMVKEIMGDKKVKRISFGDEHYEETIDADVVVLATGIRANTKLAQESGIEVDEKFKGIIVNEKMETNIPDVYSAGDCVTTINPITNEKCAAWLAGPAVRQGRVAGINAAGGEASYPGAINSFIVPFANYVVGSVGLNKEQAKEAGFEDITTGKVKAPTQPHYIPHSKEITFSIVAKTEDGTILGGEIFGEEKVDVNVNYLAIAIQKGMTVYDLMDVDFCYAPAVSETIYPIVKAADSVIRKIERKKERARRKKAKK
jgi:NADH oxidase (H2O2-forming)